MTPPHRFLIIETMKIGLNVILLYAFTLAALLFSAYKDRKKTKKAVLKGLKSLNNILPQFITVLVIVSIVLSLFDEALMTRILGEDSGFLSTIGAAVVGSITLIPGFIAFPVASELLRSGAGIVPVATFISTLMMVGIVTLPMEIEYLGKRAAVIRNTLAFGFSFPAALFVAWVVAL